MKRQLDEAHRSWLLAGAALLVYAAASVLLGWSLDPGSGRGFLWTVGMVCFGCGVPAAIDSIARRDRPKAGEPRRE